MIFNKKKILAIIPARSGSRRLKNKNLKKFINKPLIYWSIKASKLSKYIDKTVVTSDSNQILKVAKKYKADFIMKRPKYLSTSKASSWDVVRYTINSLSKKKFKFDYIILLQPTSPLRTEKHIDKCIQKMKYRDTGCVAISETKPLEWIAKLNKDKNFKSFEKGLLKYQNLKKEISYIVNGAIYLFKTDEIFKKNFMFKKSVRTFKMKQIFSVDIDTRTEFKIAEFLYRQNILLKN